MSGKPLISDALLHFDSVQPAIACWRSTLHATVPYVAAGLVLLAGATWLIYRAYPRWQVWRLRLERLDAAEVPDLAMELDALCRTAGLRRKPEFWWNPLDGRTLAIAFGTGRHRRVALTGAIALQSYTDPEAFRAVLLHELAHIRNGDVSLAYLTLSIWWAFLGTALLPYAAVDLAQPQTIFELTFFAAELGLFTFCVLLTRNAVLRSRELYADARSSSWQRDAAGLARVLGALAPIPRLRRLLSPHPAPSKRQRLIEDTDEMFRFGAWDAFGVGLSAGLAGLFLLFLTGGLFDPAEGLLPLLSIVIPVLVVVPMGAGAVALGTWRAAFLAMMRGGRGAPTLRTAAACATGGVVGWVAPFVVVVPVSAAGVGSAAGLVQSTLISPPFLALTVVTFCLLLVLALTFALAAFLAWTEATARCWLPVSLPGTSPGPAFLVGLALCLFVAAPWAVFVPLVASATGVAMHEGSHSGLLTVLWYVATAVLVIPLAPVAWVGTVAVWALPLSAALWPRCRTAAPWAFLDAGPPGTLDLSAPPIRLRRAVLLGAAGGIAAVIATYSLRLPLTAASLRGLGLSETNALVRESSRLLTGLSAQGLVAVLSVLAIPRLAISHAMCAAFVTAVLFAIGEVLHLHASLHGYSLLSAVTPVVLSFVLFNGALITLVCASVACLLATQVRWLGARIWR